MLYPEFKTRQDNLRNTYASTPRPGPSVSLPLLGPISPAYHCFHEVSERDFSAVEDPNRKGHRDREDGDENERYNKLDSNHDHRYDRSSNADAEDVAVGKEQAQVFRCCEEIRNPFASSAEVVSPDALLPTYDELKLQDSVCDHLHPLDHSSQPMVPVITDPKITPSSRWQAESTSVRDAIMSSTRILSSQAEKAGSLPKRPLTPVGPPLTPSESAVKLGACDVCSNGSPSSTVSDLIMLEDDDWPDWISDGFKWMDNRRYCLGPDFMSAAEWWTIIERAYNWETSVSALPFSNVIA